MSRKHFVSDFCIIQDIKSLLSLKRQKMIFLSTKRNRGKSHRTEEGCKSKVKLPSRADPGNTSTVTSDDNQAVSESSGGGCRERATVENGGSVQMRH